jgi:hypothetical protein
MSVGDMEGDRMWYDNLKPVTVLMKRVKIEKTLIARE